MVGGGIGGFIGETHRMAARLDGKLNLVAGALSSDPERARQSAAQCFITPERTYVDYREMAKAEAARRDGIEAVSIVTPNSSHHAIAAAFLDRGIAVICDKPLATSVQDGHDLVGRAAKAGCLLGVTYNGIGAVRIVQVEFALGWLSVPLEQEGVKQAWRTDPASAGPSGVVADIGTHAYHLMRFVTGLDVQALAADLSTLVPGRKLEDNANILLRFKHGARGALWASMVAAGESVGFRLRVYGETGHIAWDEAFPDQLHLRLLDGSDQTLHRGGKLSSFAKHATRIVSGLPEGFIEAFANLYGDYAEQITARREKRAPDPLSLLAPVGSDGVDALAFVDAVLKSGLANGSWVAME
ncbi:MAG: Gfo/Idh/MocA family oxidoreductase [Alphaproteobacteria bacterium]|nr:MAG: Gfo/Idh/MocA family oxidoreductase [Alphaproteobacteria bacterium]